MRTVWTGLKLNSVISISFNKPLLSRHNKGQSSGGEELEDEQGLQQIASKLWLMENALDYQSGPSWGHDGLWSLSEASCYTARTLLGSANSSLASVLRGLSSDFMLLCWIKEEAVSPRRPQFMFPLPGFSWHGVGYRSIHMLLQQSSGCRVSTLCFCWGTTSSSAINYMIRAIGGSIRHLWNRLTDT